MGRLADVVWVNDARHFLGLQTDSHSLVRTVVAKLTVGDEEDSLSRGPFLESPSGSGGPVSGALLFALTTVFFLSQFAIYDYPSDLSFPSEALDILPWLDFAHGSRRCSHSS